MAVEGLAKVIDTWNRLFAVELAPFTFFRRIIRFRAAAVTPTCPPRVEWGNRI